MSLTITSEPIRTINGITSTANASRSQIPFIFTTTEQAQPNFKIEIKIFDDSFTQIVSTTFKYTPKADGTLFLDVGPILTEYLEKNGLTSKQFKINYGESWTGQAATFVFSSVYFAVYAQKQIYSSGGANLYNHILDTAGTGTALTKWSVPRIYSQWKRTIGVLVDTSVSGATMTVKYLTINKDYISTVLTQAITGVDGVLNLDLQNYAVSTPSNAHWIRAEFTDSSGTILQPVDYKVTPSCSNPIFVEYLNSLGAYDQYIFDLKQEVQVASSTGIASSRAINQDYATANVTNIRVANDWVQQLICQTDQLSNGDLLAINEIKRSTSVRVLLTRDGSKFVQVVATNNLSDIYSTDNANNGFNLQLQMPNNFNVFEAIDYSLTPSQMHLNVAFTAAYN